jgi:2-C-methyl-D-erythritol 4-phosphate cytidylyltransferase/2-C-methyl-D-erythritol 2,4-cyclodiphosphate synthase
MKIAAILVAAGTGSRFGGATPKQLLLLNGKPVMRHAAEALLGHIDLLQPVGDAALIGAALAGIPHLPIVPGGTERQDSVRAGLEALRRTLCWCMTQRARLFQAAQSKLSSKR